MHAVAGSKRQGAPWPPSALPERPSHAPPGSWQSCPSPLEATAQHSTSFSCRPIQVDPRAHGIPHRKAGRTKLCRKWLPARFGNAVQRGHAFKHARHVGAAQPATADVPCSGLAAPPGGLRQQKPRRAPPPHPCRAARSWQPPAAKTSHIIIPPQEQQASAPAHS
jgi:hypothetical protein